MLFRAGRNESDSFCAFGGSVFSQPGGIEPTGRNIFEDERTESGPFHGLAGRQGALGDFDGFVEHQGDFVLGQGNVEFLRNGAD